MRLSPSRPSRTAASAPGLPGRLAYALRSVGCRLLPALLFVQLAATTDSPDDRFAQANRLYEQGDYPGAIALYESLRQAGLASAPLLFNLGNAHFKTGELGRAIANYRAAEPLAPRDPDIRANLQFARQRVTGTATVRPPAWESTLSRLRLDEWTLVTTLALWLWLGLLTAAQIRPNSLRRLRWPQRLAALTTSLALLATLAAYQQLHGHPTAIVVQPETPVRYGPLPESEVHFTARDGAELPILDHQGDWIQVTDPGRRIGWLRRDTVVLFPAPTQEPN